MPFNGTKGHRTEALVCPKNHGIKQLAYSRVLHEANNVHSSLEIKGKFSAWVEI